MNPSIQLKWLFIFLEINIFKNRFIINRVAQQRVVTKQNQIYFGDYNQNRVRNRWAYWIVTQLREKDNCFQNYSQSIISYRTIY
jgi:hypothetical protein